MTFSQTNSVATGPADAVRQEQAYWICFTGCWTRRGSGPSGRWPGRTASGGAGGTFQARLEREVTAAEQARRLAQLNAVEHGMCFGRTEAAAPGPGDGERRRTSGRPRTG